MKGSVKAKRFTVIRTGLLLGLFCGIGFGSWVVAQDKLSKFLLIKLSRDQSRILCTSSEFTSCMGFTEQACVELSESALQRCIVPLPDTILLSDLHNDVLEKCPQEVYEEAGFSNDKATNCIEKVLNK